MSDPTARNNLVLDGCRPEPLMSYLKALGALRLVAEQADPDAAGRWNDDGVFELCTRLDADGLSRFFLVDYRPTPIVGPWGARSGFYPGSSESAARGALDAIVGCDFQRVAAFRDAISSVKKLLADCGFAEKVRDDDKLRLMRLLRARLPDRMLEWIDAVYVLTDDSRGFPPLLGTGGNEGSGSYTSGFAQQVAAAVVGREYDDLLPAALFDAPARLESIAAGQFSPGAAGGPNSSQGFDGGGGVNPWDYILMMEGALLMAGSVARRMGSDSAGKAAFPFTVAGSAVGYGTAVDAEENGDASRAEIWLPLWNRPAGPAEIAHLFAEGRAQVGRRQARTGVDFARAVAGLGTDRGISAFQRFGILKRNGLSYVAAPLGRFNVTPHPEIRLLEEDGELNNWLDRFRRECSKAPGRYKAALRAIDAAVFRLAERSGTAESPRHWQDILIALGRAERALTLNGGFKGKVRPLQKLRAEWLSRCDDGTPEFRLAVALASVTQETQLGPLRIHMEPITFAGRCDWADKSPSAVWAERSSVDNLCAIFVRRSTDAAKAEFVGLPLSSRRTAELRDVKFFLEGRLDDERLADLWWGLSLLDWARIPEERPASTDGALPPPLYALFKLLAPPARLSPGLSRWVTSRDAPRSPVPDTRDFVLLASGTPDGLALASAAAVRRLAAAGFITIGSRNRYRRGPPDFTFSDPRRLLAALLFPISPDDTVRLAGLVLNPPTEDS